MPSVRNFFWTAAHETDETGDSLHPAAKNFPACLPDDETALFIPETGADG